MKRLVRAYLGLRCPASPEHGPLLEMPDGTLRCIHVAHDGRPRAHLEGPSAPTRSRFSLAEAEAAT